MKQTTIGVIGCGVIAQVYAANIHRFYQKLQLAACTDMAMEKAQAFAEKFDIPKVCTTEELLQDPGIDIILNLTIPAVHYEINKAAILCGKHVFCEKPLSLRMADAKELVLLAEQNHVMLGCAPDTFLGAALQTCRRLIDEGWIGTPIAATANMMNHGTETWHPAPDFYYKAGGGPMWDMGPYYVTALVSLFGPVAQTCCFSRKGTPEREIYSLPRRGEQIPVEIETHYSGVLRFQNGVIANMNMSFDAWLSNLPKLEIYGTDGTLIIPDPNHFSGEVKLLRKEGLIDEIDGLSNKEATGRLSRPEMWEKFKVMPSLYRQPDKNMRGIGLLDMAFAIENRRKNRASAALACHVTEVLESMNGNGGITELTTSCERPAPLPIGQDVGALD